MREALSRAAFAAMALALGCSALAGTPDVPANWRESLASDDLLEVTGTLVKLAGAGPAVREAEAAVAGLLEESRRGRLLSRWCYYALTRVSENPETHLDQYMKVVEWRPRPKGLGPNEMIVDHGGGAREEPLLPEHLQAASDVAWTTCIRAVFERWRATRNAMRHGHAEYILDVLRAPPRVMAPVMVEVLENVRAPVEERRLAAKLIGLYGWRGKLALADTLTRFMKDPTPRVRAACADALGHVYRDNCPSLPVPHPAPGSVVAAMVEALDDHDKTVRVAVLNGLYWMGRSAVHAEGDLIARREALPGGGFLMALSGLAGPRAGEILLDALRKGPSSAAVSGLKHLAFVLRQRRRDPELAALAAQAVPLMVGHLRNGRLLRVAPQCLAAFRSDAREAVPVLHDLMKNSPDAWVRGRSMFALGLIGPASSVAVPDILRCMSIGSRSTRFGIVLALGRIARGGRDVEEALLELSRSEHGHIRREAATSLGVVAKESEAVMGALERLLDDEDKDVREEAAKAVEAIRARAGGVQPTEDIDDTF